MRPIGFAIGALVAAAACRPGAGGVDEASGLQFQNRQDRAYELSTPAGALIARLDFDGDGLDDLLVGARDPDSLDKTPLRILVSQGDGGFEDRTEAHLEGEAAAAYPIGAVADFNRDGIDDVAVLDSGHFERGQSPMGGFYGERPWLLSSVAPGRWRVSDALFTAVQAADSSHCWPRCTGMLHAKSLTVGDVDGDEDPDLYIESGGGFENPNPHVMLDLGPERFEVDASDTRLSSPLIRGDTGSWRYASHALADMDGDGDLDLVMGQLRKRDNGQDALTNRIAYNDGAGRFSHEAVLELPHAAFNDGYTYVRAIVVHDLDGDSDLDLILSHERGNEAATPDPVGNTGRYLQVLLQNEGGFEDVTAKWMGPQDATTPAHVEPYGSNYNTAKKIELVDFDGDGQLDLFMREAGPIGPHAPLIYRRVADTFVPVDPAAISGEDWFGEAALPIDLDGDGVMDFVHADWVGDRTRVVPTLVRRLDAARD